MMIQDLNARARDVMLVMGYVETGNPVGSRILSRRLGNRQQLSAMLWRI